MNDNTPRQPEQAAAIRYDPDQACAPRVVAKGAGFIAEQIRSAAVQHAIPIYQNKALIGMLMAVELDREIPTALYQAVAEVLAHVYRLDRDLSDTRGLTKNTL